MYSWEIDKKIKLYNYQIPSSIYLEITDADKNPQIDHVKYDAWSDSFSMWSKDGYCWNFKVYKD